MTTVVVAMINGLLAMGFFVAAAFFVRFWRGTREGLFACFAASFALLGIQRIAGVLTSNWTENTVWLYVMRLIAFVLIIAGIIAKNRPVRGR